MSSNRHSLVYNLDALADTDHKAEEPLKAVMIRSDSWSRHSYPVQQAPPAGAPPPIVEETPVAAEKKSQPPKLPKHIRAIKDSKNTKDLGRNLIVCLDGTGDKFDADNSNIVHLVSCFKKDDRQQLTYYQSGIGTYDGGGLSNGFNAAIDMAVGSGLGVHIRDAYMFLMQTYRDGDKICLFGFSRGAYTARCLAGMIHKVGLLPAHNQAQVPFAYQYYKDDSEEGWKMSTEFKRTFCTDINVYFLGLFDSVASVGFIPRKLPLSSTPVNKPQYFRHAMGLDEHRAKFKVARYKHKDHDAPAGEWTTIAEAHEGTNGANGHGFSADMGVHKLTASGQADAKKKALLNAFESDVLEVWFTGCHADIGGGAVKNEVRHKLSQIPLRWLIRQCFECNTGIIFDVHRLAEEGIDVHTLWPVYQRLERPTLGPPPGLQEQFDKGTISPITKRSSVLEPADDHDENGLYHMKIYEDEKEEKRSEHWVPEQVEDYFDAISPINDQLVVAKGWWILEVWPIKVRVPQGDNWVKKVRMNMGRFRPVQEHDPKLHWTVQHRMAAKESQGYKIRTRLDKHAEWRITV